MKIPGYFGFAATALLMLAGCNDNGGAGADKSSPAASGKAAGRSGGEAGDVPAPPATGAKESGTSPPEGQSPAGSPGGEAGAPPAAAAAEPPATFMQCRSCHSAEPGRNGTGPSLAGVFGRPAASEPGFRYSSALQASGIVWNRDKLDQWLSGPTRMVPGTRMVLTLRGDEQRKAVIDYLETLR